MPSIIGTAFREPAPLADVELEPRTLTPADPAPPRIFPPEVGASSVIQMFSFGRRALRSSKMRNQTPRSLITLSKGVVSASSAALSLRTLAIRPHNPPTQ